ncbi:MAG: hypothetical protein JXR97_03420 [Planctomycetes bacterium]|nr:hypothetical protein [Planctomycetota bacterium]
MEMDDESMQNEEEVQRVTADLASGKYRKNGIVGVIDALGVSSMSLVESERFAAFNILGKLLADKLYNKSRESFELHYGVIASPKITGFQDTIVYEWEVPEKNAELVAVAAYYLSLVFTSSLSAQVLYSGAVSYGEYVYYENHILGPAFCDAYRLSNNANWGGVFITPAAKKYATEENELLVNYRIPQTTAKRKENKLGVLPCPCWPREFCNTFPGISSDPTNKEKAKAVFRECLNRFDYMSKDQRVQAKYKNTAEFFNWYVDNHDMNIPRV